MRNAWLKETVQLLGLKLCGSVGRMYSKFSSEMKLIGSNLKNVIIFSLRFYADNADPSHDAQSHRDLNGSQLEEIAWLLRQTASDYFTSALYLFWQQVCMPVRDLICSDF